MRSIYQTSSFARGERSPQTHHVILFSEGHAWAGVWITKRDFGQVTEPDVVAVRKASKAKEFIPVETTLLAQRPTVGFEEAVEAGRLRLSEEREHEFRMAVDITRARSARIRPLASHVADEHGEAEHINASPAKLPSPIDLGLLPAELIDSVPDTPKGRIERWQAKLLDLSLRNRLLNFKQSKQTVPCLVPDLAGLEDALAADKPFGRLRKSGVGSSLGTKLELAGGLWSGSGSLDSALPLPKFLDIRSSGSAWAYIVRPGTSFSLR